MIALSTPMHTAQRAVDRGDLPDDDGMKSDATRHLIDDLDATHDRRRPRHISSAARERQLKYHRTRIKYYTGNVNSTNIIESDQVHKESSAPKPRT